MPLDGSPMPSAVAEAALAVTVTAAPAAMLAVADPGAALDILPVSAGISGSIVAGLKTHLAGSGAGKRGVGRLQWLPTVASGASASVFAGPAMAEFVGWHSLRLIVLMHLLVGLLGSTLVDEVLSRSQLIGRLVLGKHADAVLPANPDGGKS